MAHAATRCLGVIRTTAASEGHVWDHDPTAARVCVAIRASVNTEDQKDAQGLA